MGHSLSSMKSAGKNLLRLAGEQRHSQDKEPLRQCLHALQPLHRINSEDSLSAGERQVLRMGKIQVINHFPMHDCKSASGDVDSKYKRCWFVFSCMHETTSQEV